jgi:hypothetical protein
MVSKVNEPFNYRKYARMSPHFGCGFSASFSFPEKLQRSKDKELVLAG